MKNIAVILNRQFSDRLNPVWVKEMRQMLNGWAFLGSIAALIIFGLLFSYLGANQIFDRNRDGICFIYLFFYWIALLVPVLDSISRWYYERGQDCLTPEYTTSLSAFTILRGKLMAMLTASGIQFLIGLPVFLYLTPDDYRTADFFLVAVPSFLMTSMLLFLVCLLPSRKKTVSGSLPGLVLIGLLIWGVEFFLFIGTIGGRHTKLEPAVSLYIGMLSFAAAVQFFFWCHACLLPARANRMLLPRIAGLILCLLLIPAEKPSFFNPGIVFCLYGTANILIAAFERFELTDRMRDRLPRNPGSRLIVRFFSSGTYSGLIYGILLLAVGGCWKGCPAWILVTCLYMLFYVLLTLVIRRWKPAWKPWAILLTVYGICNFVALLNTVHRDGYFSILTPMNILEGNLYWIVPAVLSAVVLLVVLIQAFLPFGSREKIHSGKPDQREEK